MKKSQITIPVVETTEAELPEALKKLVERAKEMTLNSYAPYSHFHVGAAILLESGQIVTGANQENVAYPSGTCAERSACYYANANHPGERMVAIAIAARDTSGEFVPEPISPCGACRQALLEYENLAKRPITVLLAARDRVLMLPSIASLLPLAFSTFK